MAARKRSERGSLPETIGPYRVEGRLGKGGMGEVYRGYDDRLDRPVALKRVKADSDDAQARRRLRREARAVARLSHPAIVQVHDWVETDDGNWIVMELVDGRPLAEDMASGPLAPGPAVRITKDIANGLAVAHEAGIVHRDLKAANIMLTSTGEVKILDFGIAKRLPETEGSPDSTLSAQGQLLGTVHAMSPEQAMGQGVDPRSDLFSLGILLYELLVGDPPFQGQNAVETLTRICTSKQTPVRQRNPAVPEDLSDLVDQLLEKEPARRPQTARRVVRALLSIEATHSVAAGSNEPAKNETGPPQSSALAQTVDGEWSVETLPGAGPASRWSSSTVVKTLLLCDLVDSTGLVERLGDSRGALLLGQHDRLARDLLPRYNGREIDKSDGFLMLFERPLLAVLYAQAYHRGLAELSHQEGVDLAARVGIHVGEVVLRHNPPEDVARGAKPFEVEGLAKAMAARLMSLAQGTQTLISQGVFEMGRRAVVGADSVPQGLLWVEHGAYRFQGVDEAVLVFEVGEEGQSPLVRPPDSAKVRRAVEEKPTWRRRLGVAALPLLVALVGVLVWVFRPPAEGLYVAVAPPRITGPESEESTLLEAALRVALFRGLLSLEGVSPLAPEKGDAVAGTPVELAKATAADEVISSQLTCQLLDCQLNLSRVNGADGAIRWTQSFPVLTSDLPLFHDVVEQKLRQGYPDLRSRQGGLALEVRDEDYREYLRLRQAFYFRNETISMADLLERLSSVRETSPRFLDTYLLEATVARSRFRHSRDTADLNRTFEVVAAAQELAPEDPRPIVALAMAALDSEQPQRMASALDQLEELDPGNPRLLIMRGWLLQLQGRGGEAIDIMREAVRHRPSLENLFDLSLVEMNYGETQAARQHLQELLQRYPSHYAGRSALGELELLRGNPKRAAELYESLVGESITTTEYVNLGVAYMLLDRYEQAAEAFRRVVEQEPRNPAALLNLADTELLLGQHEAAGERYAAILAILDEDPTATGWYSLLIRAQSLAHLGRVHLAVRTVQQMLQLAPDNADATYGAALVYALVGEEASALVNVEKALQQGIEARWFRFPWFDSLRSTHEFEDLMERAESQNG